MNLFENILNKTKQGFNYVATGQFGSDVFDIQQQAQQKQANPIQSFLDESKTDPSLQSKRNAVIQMIQNGEDDSFIQDTIVNKMGYNPSLTLKERVGSALGQRFQTMGESFGTEKTGLEKGLSYTKDVLMTPFDVIGGTIQPVVEPIVRPVLETAPVQAGIQAYGGFRETNPRLAQNIEAITGIGSVVAPFTKTGQAVISVPGKLVKQGAKATIQGVKKVAPSVVKGAEATVDVATAPFKSIYNTAKRYVATPEEISGIQAAIKPKQKVKNGVVQRSQKQIENEIKLTNALIRGRGEIPQGLDTYALSQKKLLEEMGSEIEKATGQPLFIDATQSAGKIRQLANSKAIQTLDPADTNALLALADRLEQNSGRMSIADAEAMNQYINDVIKSTSTTASEGYKKGLLILVQDLRDGLDSAISNIPGEFKDLKKAYGAVRNVYGDTIARQIVFNRQNLSGLVDSIGAIEGFGNIVSGAGKIVTGNVKEGFVDIGKGMTQNAVGRFIKAKNNPDNIIRSIFRQGGERAKGPNIKPKPLPMLPPPSGKATGAKNFRVNQPLDKSPKPILEKVNTEKVKRPNGNTNNTPSNSSNIPVGTKKVQEPSSKVTPKTLKKEVVKPVELPYQEPKTHGEFVENVKSVYKDKPKIVMVADIIKMVKKGELEDMALWDILSNPKSPFNAKQANTIYEALGIDISKGYPFQRLPYTPNKQKILENIKENLFVDKYGLQLSESELNSIGITENGIYKLLDSVSKPSQPPLTLSTKGKIERKPLKQSPDIDKKPYTLGVKGPRPLKSADVDISDPLYEFKTMKGTFSDEFKGKSEVMEAINDIGGIDNIKRHIVKIENLNPTESYSVGNDGVQRAIKEIQSGKKIPLIIDEAGDIMDGNHRYAAYNSLGITDIPVVSPKSFIPKPKTIEKRSFIVRSDKEEHIPKKLFIVVNSSKPNGKGQKYYKIEDETGWVYSSPRTKSYAEEVLKEYKIKYNL